MSGPGVDRELRYDPLGRLIFAREGAHVTERTYDVNGVTGQHVYGTDDAGHVDAEWTVAFDVGGRLVDLVGPTVGGVDEMTATHSYDARGRLSGIFEIGLGLFSMGYDAAGRRSTLSRPNGATTTTSYDDSGRTTAISTVHGLATLVHEILTTWDDRGLPATQTDHEGTHVYAHDRGGRLAGVDHPVGATFADEAYDHDAENHRTSTHRDPPGEMVFSDADQLLQDADFAYAYDDEGRRVSRTDRVTGAMTTYGYNVLDQMTSLVDGGTTWTFVFDARDLRVLVLAEDALGVESYGEAFAYDLNGTVRGSYDTAGVRTASYLAGPEFGDVLAFVDAAGAAEFSLRDRLGTTTGWLGTLGTVTELITRDAYGVRTAPPRVVPFGFTGHSEDPTGLSWGRARTLSPTTGVWTSEDPRFNQNRYAYATASPALLVDPSGEAAALEIEVILPGTSTPIILTFYVQVPVPIIYANPVVAAGAIANAEAQVINAFVAAYPYLLVLQAWPIRFF